MNIQVFLFISSPLSTEQLPSHLFSRQTFMEAFRPHWVLVLIQSLYFGSKAAPLSRKKFHNNFHKCQACLWKGAVARYDAFNCLWLFYHVEKNLVHAKNTLFSSQMSLCTLKSFQSRSNDECSELQLTLKMLKTWGEAEGVPTVWSLKDEPVMACSSVPLSSRSRPDTWQDFTKWKACGPAEGVVA